MVSHNLPVTELAEPTTEADPSPSNEPDTTDQVNGGGADEQEEEGEKR